METETKIIEVASQKKHYKLKIINKIQLLWNVNDYS